MTLIVSDNSPLNVLVRLGEAGILPLLFGRVIVPPEVVDEMTHVRAPKVVREFIASPPAWLEIREPSKRILFPNLDAGESAAISLAVELKAILMVDERDGREAAIAHGVEIIGVIGVLEKAANGGIVQDLSGLHDRIRSMEFHVSDAILKASLARHIAHTKR